MTLDEIRELSAFALSDSDLADCGTPDTAESAGAGLLTWVRTEFVNYVKSNPDATPDDVRDAVHEMIDGAVSIYTATKWQQFVDLAAYLEEPESGEWPTDLDQVADAALYQIADRLAYALIASWEESQEEEEEESPVDMSAPVTPMTPEAEARLADVLRASVDRARAARLPEVPEDFPVRPLGPNDAAQDRVTCGTCGRSWDDAVVTSMTPAPAARCPFEHFHADEA